MTNKITIELEIPIDTDNCEELLLKQTEFLVEFWRGILSKYKGKVLPSIYLKRPKGSKLEAERQESAIAKKQFYKTLIDHHLQFMPKDNVGAQMQAIKKLFATGKAADELIELYEHSRSTYKLTSWHTVAYKLSKPAAEEEATFARKALDDKEKADIISRLRR